MEYPSSLRSLISYFQKLPGVGKKSGERLAFSLLGWEKREVDQFAKAMEKCLNQLNPCPECGCLVENFPCLFCDETKRDRSRLCVLSSIKDVFAIEKTGQFNGLYHLLGGLLSPLDDLEEKVEQTLDKLFERIRAKKETLQEVVLALDSTLEGDATSLYIKEKLKDLPLSVSRLAFGIPLGSSLDFIDDKTLIQAFTGRLTF